MFLNLERISVTTKFSTSLNIYRNSKAIYAFVEIETYQFVTGFYFMRLLVKCNTCISVKACCRIYVYLLMYIVYLSCKII